MNWPGRPLTSHQVIVDLIGATTTRTELKVHAELDPGVYATKVKIPDEQMNASALDRHDFHGEWNYTLRPEPVRDADTRTLFPHKPLVRRVSRKYTHSHQHTRHHPAAPVMPRRSGRSRLVQHCWWSRGRRGGTAARGGRA